MGAARFTPARPHDRPRQSGSVAAIESRRRISPERRRRERHFRRRRRDLVFDIAFAIALTVGLITVTAGLGVLVLLAIPIALLLAGSLVAERIRRRPGPAGRGTEAPRG